MLIGFHEVNGKTYCFDNSGMMYIGWKRINGKKYLFDPIDGHMHTGWEWVSENSAWYYLSPQTGYLLEGWLDYKGRKYYLTPVDYYAKTGWQKIDGKWYFFDKKNADMKTGWLSDGGKTYYLRTNGVMATGTQSIDGKTYTFGPLQAVPELLPALPRPPVLLLRPPPAFPGTTMFIRPPITRICGPREVTVTCLSTTPQRETPRLSIQ